MGQLLALRPDLIPQDYCDQLVYLLDEVPPFSWAEARGVLVEEFGREPYELFTSIESVPAAAGSLAQTHFARLKDGTPVAVKIQRPNVQEAIRRDLRVGRRIASLLELSGISPVIRPTAILKEIASWLAQEVDFQQELANLERLYPFSRSSAITKMPRPFPELCTSRVLTTGYIDGVRVSHLLRWVREGRTDQIRSTGLDLEVFAANLVKSLLGQMFRFHFFHADLHPGNLMALPNNAVGFVDFGLCDKTDESVKQKHMRYLHALYREDLEQMFRSLMEILIPPPNADQERFRADFRAETSKWMSRRDSERAGSTERSPLADWMMGVLSAARRNGYQLPPRILSMYRALLGAESVAHQLGVSASMAEVGKDFFVSLQIEETVRSLEPPNLQPVVLSVINLLRDSPGQLNQILSDIAEGKYSVNVNMEERPNAARQRDRRSRLLATAIVSVSVALLLTKPGMPASMIWGLTGLLALIYVLILIQSISL
jgi:ubiquinone biosynthesis protein